jgi:predicted signal transduction protein with EAL and GGDEF domain
VELAAWAALGQGALIVETLPFHAAAAALVLVALLEERARRWLEAREQQAQFAWLARHDAASGARSRHAFLADLDRQLAVEPAASLMLVHVGRLEAVNASLGHEVADAVAAEAVARLRSLFKILPARIGGDVFALNLPAGLDDTHRSLLPARLRVMLGQPFEVEGHQVVVSPTCGFSETSPETRVGAAELLRQAEVALATARQNRTGSALFTQAQAQRIADRRRLDLALRRALNESQFHLLFQPQIDLKSGAMVGVEALVRWQSPELGLVSPADFIPVAEESGVIVALGDWVMREACRQAAEWHWTGNISVNVSTIQFRLGNVVGTVKRALAESGLAPEWLDLEITESVFIDNDETVRSTLEELRALGVTIALDDFGTGYSSLGYLNKAVFHKLKIDGSFVREAADNRETVAIIQSIVQLAKSFRMTVTAEGVETADDFTRMRDLGCHQIQGYLFGRPMDFDRATDLIRGIQTRLSA